MDNILLSIHPVPLGEDERALWQYNYNHRSYTNSSRWGSSDWDKQDPVAYARALSGFVFALMIYFCVLFYLCDKYGDASKKTVDKSIVKKKVLPHGQSQLFHSADSDGDAEREKNDGRRCRHCCHCGRRQKDAVAPAPAETADDILEEYRAKSYLHRIRHHLHTAAQPTNATDDELVLAEEGAANNTEENVCPICIEQYRVGELVAWSKMGHCRHVFHYECILPWAVLGNVLCPVCRGVLVEAGDPAVLMHNSEAAEWGWATYETKSVLLPSWAGIAIEEFARRRCLLSRITATAAIEWTDAKSMDQAFPVTFISFPSHTMASRKRSSVSFDESALQEIRNSAAVVPFEPEQKPKRERLDVLQDIGNIKVHTVVSTSGGSNFTVTLPNGAQFTTNLVCDARSEAAAIEWSVPPSLDQKQQRLSVDSFNDFVHAKKNGGNWHTVAAKLSVGRSESDRKACKSFCNKYTDRVASVKVSDSLRVFFVTPGLQEQCRCLAGKMSRCPMVVVLKRKKGVL